MSLELRCADRNWQPARQCGRGPRPVDARSAACRSLRSDAEDLGLEASHNNTVEFCHSYLPQANCGEALIKAGNPLRQAPSTWKKRLAQMARQLCNSSAMANSNRGAITRKYLIVSRNCIRSVIPRADAARARGAYTCRRPASQIRSVRRARGHRWCSGSSRLTIASSGWSSRAWISFWPMPARDVPARPRCRPDRRNRHNRSRPRPKPTCLPPMIGADAQRIVEGAAVSLVAASVAPVARHQMSRKSPGNRYVSGRS